MSEWIRGEHIQYRPVFQEEDICSVCTEWPDKIVNWPCPGVLANSRSRTPTERDPLDTPPNLRQD